MSAPRACATWFPAAPPTGSASLGPWTAGLAAQILLTYLVPFCVATWGALGSARVPADRGE